MRTMTDEQAEALLNDARPKIESLVRGKFRIVSGKLLPGGWIVEIRELPDQQLRAFQKVWSGQVCELRLA